MTTTKASERTRAARAVRVVVMLLALGLVCVACLGQSEPTPRHTRPAATVGGTPIGPAARPNIVFILTDDLSMNLVPYLSAVRTMAKRGTSFSNMFVTDSLCCPSRASILTGRYPHHTRVLVNENNRDDYPGGYTAFERYGNQEHTYARALHRAGYRTGFMGKYLNGYSIDRDPIPPGWDEWHASDNGYTEVGRGYRITDVQQKGAPKNISRPDAYLNDLLGSRARDFLDRAKKSRQPFFLQISTFAPHNRTDGGMPLFPAATRDRPGGEHTHGDCGTRPNGGRYDCAALAVRRTNAFNKATYDMLDTNFRDRVRMMQSLNDQIVRLRKRLATNGQLANTYIVFGSDNGYHLGDHGLLRGKGSAYDHDTRVPLIVEGPGVRRSQVREEIVQTVDLSPTFQQLAGLTPMPSDGHGLIDLLRGDHTTRWRSAALIEHKPQQGGTTGHRTVLAAAADPDPDRDTAVVDTARVRFAPAYHPYNAIRTKNWLYVAYSDHARPELYDLTTDPGQNHNVAASHPREVQQLNAWLTQYSECGADTTGCWQAGG